MESKLIEIDKAIDLVKSGSILGIGGNTLNRVPMSLVFKIIEKNITNLKLIKTAGAIDIDMLCLAGLVDSVDAGFVSYESEFGLATFYRKGVESGRIKGNEHACYTVISALRASSVGAPFMPVYGLKNSDLIGVNDYFKEINDPFTGEKVTVVRAMTPDVAIIHVQEADEFGNAYIHGPKYDDILLAKSSKKVILSADRIVPSSKFEFSDKKADISSLFVDKVVKARKGAYPTFCYRENDIEKELIKKFKKLKSKEELLSLIESDINSKWGVF